MSEVVERPSAPPLVVDVNLITEVGQFLDREAMLLDEQRFDEWLDTLDAAVRYEVPVRVITKGGKGEFETGAYRMNDGIIQLRARVARNVTGHAWAEDPPSRMVRTVGSIYVEQTEDEEIVRVHSTVYIYRRRAQDDRGDTIPVRRRDELRRTKGGYRLLHRTVFTPDNVLMTPNLAIFF